MSNLMESRIANAGIDQVSHPDLRKLMREAILQGWHPGGARKHGVRLLAPDGVHTVSFPKTTSDTNSVRAVLSNLRRFGFESEIGRGGSVTSTVGKRKRSKKSTYALRDSERGLHVLDCLIKEARPMTSREIADAMGWPPSDRPTVYASLRNMEIQGKVIRHAEIPSPHNGRSQVQYVAQGVNLNGVAAAGTPIPGVPKPIPDEEPADEPQIPQPRVARRGLYGLPADVMKLMQNGIYWDAKMLSEKLGKPQANTSSTLSKLCNDGYIKAVGRKRYPVPEGGQRRPSFIQYQILPESMVTPERPATPPVQEPEEDILSTPVQERPVLVGRSTFLGLPAKFWSEVALAVATAFDNIDKE